MCVWDRELLKDDPVFYVPEVIWDFTSKQVLSSELVSGVPLDKVSELSQTKRNWVSLLDLAYLVLCDFG